MLNRLLLAALLIGAFAYGVTQLFLLRFHSGEVYPIYCSLRSDPLGAKAFHDALRELPHLEVQRNFRGIVKLQPAAPVTLFYAGTPSESWWDDQELRHVEQLAVTGSRIVITFLPEDRGPSAEEAKRRADLEKERTEKRREKLTGEKKEKPKSEKDDEKKTGEKAKKKKGDAEDEMPLPYLSFNEVAAKWGFEFKFFPHRDPKAAVRRAKATGAETEPDLSWHSALHFGKLKDSWRTVYAVEKEPVIIERSFGAGSIVLASDSYFLSNEALRNERSPRLLAWLVGSPKSVVFDEESHGVREEQGVASLARKYGLQGVAAALVLIAALFVWKNAAPFLPPLEDSNADGDHVRGRESGEGLVNLLRRSVAPAQVLGVCAEEWRKAFDHTGKSPKSAHLEKVLADEVSRPAHQRDPVAAYSTIARELSKKT